MIVLIFFNCCCISVFGNAHLSFQLFRLCPLFFAIFRLRPLFFWSWFPAMLFSAMPAFLLKSFSAMPFVRLCPFSFEVIFLLCLLFGYAHFSSEVVFGYAFFRLCPPLCFIFVFFIFRPCMPIAQMRLAVRDGFFMFSLHLCLFPPTSIVYF